MKIKYIISRSMGLVLLVAVVALIIVNGNSNDSNSIIYSASILTVVENNFDFNKVVMEGGDVSHVFEIKNEGTEPVEIKKIYTSCMCTTAYITDSFGKQYGKFGMAGHDLALKINIKVESGESITVKAIFDPKAHGLSGVGLVERSIYLETNSVKLPRLELSFLATVIR